MRCLTSSVPNKAAIVDGSSLFLETMDFKQQRGSGFDAIQPFDPANRCHRSPVKIFKTTQKICTILYGERKTMRAARASEEWAVDRHQKSIRSDIKLTAKRVSHIEEKIIIYIRRQQSLRLAHEQSPIICCS